MFNDSTPITHVPLTLSLWILTFQSSGQTINIYDTSHHFAANRRTDSHASWHFSSLSLAILCFINREVLAAWKKSFIAGSFFPYSKSMIWWLSWLRLLSFLTFSLNWHGTLAQSNASCLPFYNWVSRYAFISSLDLFTIYPSQTFNSVHQSPCQVASSLLAVCNGGRKE